MPETYFLAGGTFGGGRGKRYGQEGRRGDDRYGGDNRFSGDRENR